MLTLLFLLVVSILWPVVKPQQEKGRVHQHLENHVAAPDGTSEKLTTHLPIITIDTEGGKAIPQERGTAADSTRQQSVRSQIQLFDEANKVHSTDDTPRATTLAEVAYRGNSSRHFDKKSLKVRFIDDKGEDSKLTLAGMAEESEWVLHGPFLDRTLVRNYLAYNISGEIMEYAPNVRYCELVLNGKYQGLYLAVESIEQGPYRIAIDKSDPKSTTTPYIVVWDRSHKAKNVVDNYVRYIHQSGISTLDIRYPNIEKITDAQKDFIEKDISKIERILYSYDLKQYDQYLDKNAFAEYFIINEFFRNADAGKFSTYLYKDLREKMKLAVWDFNNAFDNYSDVEYDAAGFTMLDVPWFSMLIKDREFIDLVVNKYHELRKTTLSTAYLEQYVDDTVSFLGPAVERNNDKWGYVFDLSKPDGVNYLVPFERNQKSYEESVDSLKDFIEDRGRWLDDHIETLYQYSAPSKNTNTLLE